MAQKMCMVVMMVMLLVTVKCATINKGIEDYNSCVTDCVARCGADEHCQYRCRWRCAKPHTSQLILKDEAVSPQHRNPVCEEYCHVVCDDDVYDSEVCMRECLKTCSF